MRYRTRGTLASPPTIPFLRFDPTCASAGTWVDGASNVYGIRIGEVQHFYDTVTPNFRSRISRGEMLFNPMTSLKCSYSTLNGQGYHARAVNPSCSSPLRYAESKRDGDQLQAFLPKGPDSVLDVPRWISDEVIRNLITEASTKLQNQIGRGDANLWESLAEADKALTMGRSAATEIQTVIRNAVNNIDTHKNRLARISSAAGSLWLLYRYGLKPIMSDIDAVFLGLTETLGKTRHTTRARLRYADTKLTVYDHTHGSFKTKIAKAQADAIEVRAMSIDEYVATRLNNIGFNAKGLITLPWELITLSFVVDWFANIGDLLGALTPNFGWSNLGSCLVYERTTSISYTSMGTVCHDGTNVVLRPVTGAVTGALVDRNRSGLPFAGLVVKNYFKLDQIERAADAFSLVAQRLGDLEQSVRKAKRTWGKLYNAPYTE